jgi:hypothetical protein|tara:strand:- start:431 stop:826 length:396 start_codon:yes stop_codon:yes gene_type:complete
MTLSVAELLDLSAFGYFGGNVSLDQAPWAGVGAYRLCIHGVDIGRVPAFVQALDRLGFDVEPDLAPGCAPEDWHLRACRAVGSWVLHVRGFVVDPAMRVVPAPSPPPPPRPSRHIADLAVPTNEPIRTEET